MCTNAQNGPQRIAYIDFERFDPEGGLDLRKRGEVE